MTDNTMSIFVAGVMVHLVAVLVNSRTVRHSIDALGAAICTLFFLASHHTILSTMACILFAQHLNLAVNSVTLLDPLDRLLRRPRPDGANVKSF